MTEAIRSPDQVDREVLIQERRAIATAREEERRAALIDASPACEREACGHKLCFHEPCSKCECPEFIGERRAAREMTD